MTPDMPTRAEREFERELDALEENFRDRHYSAALKNAQTLVILTHSLALFGRQGVDAIPVNEAAPIADMLDVVGWDAPAGAGHEVEADRG